MAMVRKRLKVSDAMIPYLKQQLQVWDAANRRYSKALGSIKRTKTGGAAWTRHEKALNQSGAKLIETNAKLFDMGFKSYSHALRYVKQRAKRRILTELRRGRSRWEFTT